MHINFSSHKPMAILSVGLIAWMLSVSLKADNIRTPTGQLDLIATVDGKPAFSNMTWRLRRESTSGKMPEKTFHRHSAVLHLQPGAYEISATLNDKTLTKYITIREGREHELKFPMD